MSLRPELIKRRRRILRPRALPQRPGARVIGAAVLTEEYPPFPLPPKDNLLPKITVLGRTFRQQVAEATAVLLSMRCPLNGFIKELNPHFPDGSNALVLMRFGTDRHGQCYPETGFLALNNATPVFKVNISVEYDERLWLEIQNQDAVHPHTPSLSLTIEGR